MADGGAYEEYQKRGDQIVMFSNYFKNSGKDLGFHDTETCLSIRPAFGSIDSQILKFSMPKCRQYYGVEPSEVSVAGLKQTLQATCPNIKADIFHGDETSWPGPAEPVDTILAFHSMYYIKDRREFLRKCVKDWLKPTGRLIVVHNTCENSFFQVAKDFPELMKSNESFHYFQPDVEQELNNLKFTYKVDTFMSHCDLTNVNQNLANFYLQKNASAEEITRLSKIVSKCYPSGTEELTNFVTVVMKQ